MKRAERHEIEAALDPHYRGRLGFKRMLEDVSLCVCVSGIRGKSGLTRLTVEALRDRGLCVYGKMTGTDPVSMMDGRIEPIVREPRKPVNMVETMWEVKRFWPMDAVVLENQGITPYTMRVFNTLYSRPDYVLVTNIRRDHLGDLARELPAMAKAFARSVPRGSCLISGERSPHLRNVMADVCRKRGVRFIDAAPRRRLVPGFECVTILDAMLQDWLGEGLAAPEMDMMQSALQERFRWQPSNLPDVPWFPAAEVNDVDSTRAILEYLFRQQPRPLTFVAYLRRDRPDRTASFVPFLQQAFEDGRAERLILVGPRSRWLARRLRDWRENIHILPDRLESVETAMQLLRDNAAGGAVMTIMNAVPPWPRRLAELLQPEPHDVSVEFDELPAHAPPEQVVAETGTSSIPVVA